MNRVNNAQFLNVQRVDLGSNVVYESDKNLCVCVKVCTFFHCWILQDE
jgi:hypothetical protein